jgi:hypothetical protein
MSWTSLSKRKTSQYLLILFIFPGLPPWDRVAFLSICDLGWGILRFEH